MLRICENCGAEFDGAAQARFHSDACRKAFARRVDESLPSRQVEEEEAPAGERAIETILRLTADEPLTDQEEQLLRDHFGYAPSEKRTRAERAGVAQRLTASAEPLHPNVAEAIAKLDAAEREHKRKQEAYRASLKVPSPAG